MKILVILNYYYPYVSGLSEYARLLCEEMCRIGNSVTVLTSKHESNLADKENINGVNVVRAPVWFKISKGVVSAQFIIWAARYARFADVVHLHLPMLEAGIIASLVSADKIVCTYHCDINLPDGLFNSIILKTMDTSHRHALLKARAIVVNTIEYAEKSRIAYKYVNKMKEIYPPIKALPIVERKNHDRFRIGFCGRIVQEKGIDILIKAFEVLQKERLNIELVIGGEYKTVAGGSVYKTLNEYIRNHNIMNISFIGKIPEEKMAEFYASLDVFVLPSVNALESFGMVQVEAMLCGTPIIASDLLGVRTVVCKTGMGLICRSGDVEDLKRCLIEIMDNYELYIRSRAQIEEIYSIEQCTKKYVEVYKK